MQFLHAIINSWRWWELALIFLELLWLCCQTCKLEPPRSRRRNTSFPLCFFSFPLIALITHCLLIQTGTISSQPSEKESISQVRNLCSLSLALLSLARRIPSSESSNERKQQFSRRVCWWTGRVRGRPTINKTARFEHQQLTDSRWWNRLFTTLHGVVRQWEWIKKRAKKEQVDELLEVTLSSRRYTQEKKKKNKVSSTNLTRMESQPIQ